MTTPLLNPTTPPLPTLADAREALRVADAGRDIPALWVVYCPRGHHVSSWNEDPKEAGLHQRCSVWVEEEQAECSDVTDGEERDDNAISEREATHFEDMLVNKELLRVALAEVDSLKIRLDALSERTEADRMTIQELRMRVSFYGNL